VGKSFAILSLELWLGGVVCSQPHFRLELWEHRRELLRPEDRHRTAAEGVGRRHIVVVEDRLGRDHQDHQGREVVDPIDLEEDHRDQKQEDRLDMLDIVADRGIRHLEHPREEHPQQLEDHLDRQIALRQASRQANDMRHQLLIFS